jgi:hypothetical protein
VRYTSRWCTTGVLEDESMCPFLVHIGVLPANACKKRVDPRGLEPLTSAMRGRQQGFAAVRGSSENRLFKLNLLGLRSRLFAGNRLGNCQRHCQNLLRTSVRPRGSEPATSGLDDESRPD